MREEIVESQKARIDLLKWKIIAVAAISGAALGLGSNPATSHYDFLFCLIPLVCVYVDLVCCHLNLRILVIGSYLRMVHARQMAGENVEPNDADYEDFAEEVRSMPPSAGVSRKGLNAFVFEDRALHLSSAVLSLLVVAWGIFAICESMTKFVLIAAGLLGFLVSLWARHIYRQHVDALEGMVREGTRKLRNLSVS